MSSKDVGKVIVYCEQADGRVAVGVNVVLKQDGEANQEQTTGLSGQVSFIVVANSRCTIIVTRDAYKSIKYTSVGNNEKKFIMFLDIPLDKTKGGVTTTVFLNI